MSSQFRTHPVTDAAMATVLSVDRLTPYLNYSSGDLHGALELYVWNAALASAFLPVIGAVEISLRNVMNDRLVVAYSAPWYDDANFLALDQSGNFRKQIDRCKNYIARAKPVRTITVPRIVAELGLSFWVGLLKPGFQQSLWPILSPAFVRYTRRKTLMRLLEPSISFRNRVAHHEPIHDRNPSAMYANLLAASEIISPGLSSWIERHGRIRQILTAGPVPPRLRF